MDEKERIAKLTKDISDICQDAIRQAIQKLDIEFSDQLKAIKVEKDKDFSYNGEEDLKGTILLILEQVRLEKTADAYKNYFA